MYYYVKESLINIFNNLNNSLIIPHVYRLLNNPDKEKLLTVENFYKIILSDANDNSYQQIKDDLQKINNWRNLDYRFKFLRLRGFRAIGTPNDRDNSYYGLNFCLPNDNTPATSILLGHNGCGKTSLYCSMELLFKNTTSLFKKRRTLENKDKEEDFYKNIYSKSLIDIKIHINNDDNIYSYPSAAKNLPLEEFNQSADYFFCSEADIALCELSQKDIDEYVYDQLGISELKNIKKLLIETREINKSEIIKEFQTSDTNTLESINLKELKEDFLIQPKLLKIETELTKIIGLLDSELQRLQDSVLTEIQTILEQILNEIGFFNSDEKLNSTENNGIKLFDGKINTQNTPISPKTYFNNFRFKLYLISIKIAVAFNFMKQSSINFPLIFDDVLNASDFVNRSEGTRDFIKNIFSVHQKMFGKNTELQLIFFTQDEVIAEAVFNGIIDINLNEDKNNKVVLQKLYDTSDIDIENDFTKIPNSDIEFFKLSDYVRYV